VLKADSEATVDIGIARTCCATFESILYFEALMIRSRKGQIQILRSIGVREGIETRVNRGCTNFVIYFLFDLWTFYLARILFLKGCGSFFWESTNSIKIFNGLQHSFQVWQGFIIISKSFSYKDSLFILATKRKEDFRINSTFISDFLMVTNLILGYLG
jgi:hypothetical protein